MKNIIKVDNVSKHYNKGKSHTVALDNVSFNLSKEESISIIGPSGSGKTTLLHIIGGLDNPSSGKVYIDGKLINNMSDNKLSEFRNKKIGFVFQFFNLQDYLTAEENVGLPAKMAGREEKEAKQKAEELLELVGLKYRRDHYPNEMSGGEMQRVAIARALVNEPKILLADEPTGNLDKDNTVKILDVFTKVAESGVSIIFITHDTNISKVFPNTIRLDKGVLV